MNRIASICLIAVVMLLACCDKQEPPKTRVQVFSIGQSAWNNNSKLIYNYGGHAIRIDDGTAVLRMFRISDGAKTQELEQVLDSSKHQLAWITPRVVGDDVQIEFGSAERTGSQGTRAQVTFKSPYSVGSAARHLHCTMEDGERNWIHYWIYKEAGVEVNASEDISEESLIKTSKAKPVDFLLITITKH